MATIGPTEAKADLLIVKGSTFKANMQWLTGPENNRVPVDITDLIFRIQARRDYDSSAVIIQLMSHYPPGLEAVAEGIEFSEEDLTTNLSTWVRYTRSIDSPSKAAVYVDTAVDPDDGVLTYAQNGKFTLYIPHTITRRLMGASGIYDVEILENDEYNNIVARKLWGGSIQIKNEATRVPVGDFTP